MPFCHEWDEARALPLDLFRKCAKAGFLAGVIGPPWPAEFADYPIMGGLKPEEVCTFRFCLCFVSNLPCSLMHFMN